MKYKEKKIQLKQLQKINKYYKEYKIKNLIIIKKIGIKVELKMKNI